MLICLTALQDKDNMQYFLNAQFSRRFQKNDVEFPLENTMVIHYQVGVRCLQKCSMENAQVRSGRKGSSEHTLLQAGIPRASPLIIWLACLASQ